MARLIAAMAGIVLSLGVASCGGTQISADEVEAAPPELTIPTTSADSADALAGPEGSSTPEATSTPDADGSTGDSTGQTGDEPAASDTGASGGSGAATPQAAPQATATPAAPGGAQAPAPSGGEDTGSTGAEKFEEFCQQNAGAC